MHRLVFLVVYSTLWVMRLFTMLYCLYVCFFYVTWRHFEIRCYETARSILFDFDFFGYSGSSCFCINLRFFLVLCLSILMGVILTLWPVLHGMGIFSLLPAYEYRSSLSLDYLLLQLPTSVWFLLEQSCWPTVCFKGPFPNLHVYIMSLHFFCLFLVLFCYLFIGIHK